MAEQRSPLDRALDVVVFAPLGLVLAAQEQLPNLVELGRRRWGSQATMARVVGELAVGQGRKEADKALRRASQLLVELGGARGQAHPGGKRDSDARPSPTSAPAPASSPPASSAASSSRASGAGAPPTADLLAIPGYDALSAPQVVSRLDGLSGEELEAVRAYEAGTRGRKTILGRVGQLQALLS